ncbi:MAG: hypothetical protein IJP46_03615 [Prevotella sp.]|nr:hypothetical protein [Prevotella sp.]
MKKSLLIAVAALFVALGANAQFKRVPQATKVKAPMEAKSVIKKATGVDAIKHDAIKKANAPRRAASDLAGDYIMDFGNWDGDFLTSSMFTITAVSGTTTILGEDSEGNVIDESFEYNLRLDDFTYEGESVYAYYDEANAYIRIPRQVIATSFINSQNKDLGRVVFSGLVTQDGSPYNFGFDVIFDVDEEGNLYNYDFADELADNGWPEGCAVTGFYDYLPDYNTGSSYVAMGTSMEFYIPNAFMGDVECHIESGSWGAWQSVERQVCVEDFGTELYVHNFLGLCPISITIAGDKASVACPVRVMDDDFADEGQDPDYIQIWQWDATFENIINPGAITGNISTLSNGAKLIEFYDTEYKDAWTDDQGEHEAGDYIITDYTKWFMVHSTWGAQGAYFWGEARSLYVVIPSDDPSGIIAPKATTDTKNTTLYDLQGRVVDGSYKGIVISNGKKMVVK